MRAAPVCLLILGFPTLAFAQSTTNDWPAYGRDRGGERFSPLSGIDRGNVKRLAPAWEYSTGEAAVKMTQSASSSKRIRISVRRVGRSRSLCRGIFPLGSEDPHEPKAERQETDWAQGRRCEPE